MRKDTSLIRY